MLTLLYFISLHFILNLCLLCFANCVCMHICKCFLCGFCSIECNRPYILFLISSWVFPYQNGRKWKKKKKMDHDLLCYAFVLRCILHVCVCFCKDKYRRICLSGGSMRSGMTVKWNVTCQCVHLHVTLNDLFILFYFFIWADLFIFLTSASFAFCFGFLNGLIAPSCPILFCFSQGTRQKVKSTHRS